MGRSVATAAIITAVFVGVGSAACSSRGPNEALDPPPLESPDWQTCRLADALVNSSHVVDLRVDGVTTDDEFLPAFGFAPRDRAPIYFLDTATGTITAVHHERIGDPRPATGEIEAGSPLAVSARRGGPPIETVESGETITVAAGRFAPGSSEEWRAHLVVDLADDGSIDFGRDQCGIEYARQLGELRDGLLTDTASVSDVDALTALIDIALEALRLADLQYLAAPADQRRLDPDFAPPVAVGEARRLYWFVTGMAGQELIVATTSAIGASGHRVPSNAPSGQVAESYVAATGALDVILIDGLAFDGPSSVVASFPDVTAVDALRVEVRSATDVSVESISFDELAVLDPLGRSAADFESYMATPIEPIGPTGTVDFAG